MPAAFDTIESRQNPRFKLWSSYARHPEDKQCPWVPVEGPKQIRDIAGTHRIPLLLFSDPDSRLVATLLPQVDHPVLISPKLLAGISNVESPQAIIAFFEKPRWTWDCMTPWVLYFHRLQDPGNLGTLFRTAAATGMFSIVCGAGTVSCFNAKVVRASASALFSVPCLEDVPLSHLKQRGFRVTATWNAAERDLYQTSFKPPLAIVVGNEGAGLDDDVLDAADDRIAIPMQKGTESLNAAVAGSLVAYEIYRQKMYS